MAVAIIIDIVVIIRIGIIIDIITIIIYTGILSLCLL